jgi:hypothetical protein
VPWRPLAVLEVTDLFDVLTISGIFILGSTLAACAIKDDNTGLGWVAFFSAIAALDGLFALDAIVRYAVGA